MSHTEWTEQFEEILRKNLTKLGPDVEFGPGSVLADLGLDSMSAVSLLLDLEEAFDVIIPDESLTTLLTSGSVGELWSTVEGLRV